MNPTVAADSADIESEINMINTYIDFLDNDFNQCAAKCLLGQGGEEAAIHSGLDALAHRAPWTWAKRALRGSGWATALLGIYEASDCFKKCGDPCRHDVKVINSGALK